ncbi:DUF3379 family protein [Aliikangiella coralliicola]|uniref:DUF3379 domain-containing protein n=1 Tax=Aliikangiella coralliicola TaxID=2592383 RepID=A0A545U735_9GAMM|nr:DUF3379 family protein [Aliikangiella coralliicola]TQV85289.1 DUF3379 domain-containing protein [Aliikangiella coralliicola]
MDELEKKRRQLADPKQHIENFDEQSPDNMSEQELAQLKADQNFERQLLGAFSVPVPEQLSEKILLNQRLQKRRNIFSLWALAASISILSMLSFMTTDYSQSSLTQQALKHVYHEEKYLTGGNPIARDEIERRLAKYGVSLPSLPEKVVFASRCGFGGESAMHIIAEIDGKPVTLLLTPIAVEDNKSFGDDRFVGKMRKTLANNLIVIAEDLSLVERFFQQIGDA